MNPYKVFIVGHEGTTGLRIHERLSVRKDITLLSISDEDRKNIDVIASIAKNADIVFLCLPDAASKEVVAAIGDYPCKIIDTSTAFRTADDWAYGFPELGESYKNDIKTKQHIANPGCHASGMIACIAPLVKGILKQRQNSLIIQRNLRRIYARQILQHTDHGRIIVPENVKF